MRKLLVLILLIAGPFLQAQVTLDAKSSVDDVLKALQARGQTLTDFTAEVVQTNLDLSTMHETVYRGKILFQKLADGDARIRVNFQHKKSGRSPEAPWHREYALAKGILIDQDFDSKLEAHRQVLKPGQKMDPLKLGEGPFPLPLGQDPAEVKKNFTVTLVPITKDDPGGTLHAQLKPIAGKAFAKKYDVIEVWVDMKTQFTPRITVIEANDGNEITTELSKPVINGGLKDADFQLDPPVEGWNVTDEPLR